MTWRRLLSIALGVLFFALLGLLAVAPIFLPHCNE